MLSGSFLGDIAVSGVEYGDDKKTKDRQAYAEKLEKYKKEINEGLQIEEEGIIQGTNKAVDVSQIKIRHRHNNRTRKNQQNKRKKINHLDKNAAVDDSFTR